MRTVWYTVQSMAVFGVSIYPSRVRDMVTTSAVASVGYEPALGGAQTCNIGLPLHLLMSYILSC